MSIWMLAAASVLYLLASIDYFKRGDYGMSLAFVAYSLANIGFILANK